MVAEAGLEVGLVDARGTHALRRLVLRSHMPGAPVTSPEDDLATTSHLGARRAGELVGVVTAFLEPCPARPGQPAMRFRWMAVDPAAQRGGVGQALMSAVEATARAEGAVLLWANGRQAALGFYERLGFTAVGPLFTDAVSGLPHCVVLRDL